MLYSSLKTVGTQKYYVAVFDDLSVIDIPVPTALSSKTADELAQIFPKYIAQGLHRFGESGVYTPANFSPKMQEVIEAQGYTSGDTINGVWVNTKGDNLFNKLKYDSTTAYSYLIEVNAIEHTWSESIGYKLYDINGTELSSGTASTVTPSQQGYIAFNNTISDIDNFALSQGDTAIEVEYEENTYWTDFVGSDIGGVYDDFEYQRISSKASVSIGATINNTTITDISLSSDFIAVDETTGETQYGTYGDTLTLTNTATVWYVLATPIAQELTHQGALTITPYGQYTLTDVNGVGYKFYATSSLNNEAQAEQDRINDVKQGKDIKALQIKTDEIETRICGTHEAIQILELTAAKINPSTSKPDYDYASQSYLFPQNDTTERLYAVLPSPNNWVVGTPIRIQAHITQEDTGQAVMKVDYKLFEAFGATIPATATTYTMDTYVDDSYVSGSMSNALRDGVEIDTSDITTRAFIRLEIYRDDNVYSGDLKVDDVAIFYTAYNCCSCKELE